jgi:serine/threonine protein phosphatase 1
VTDRIALDVAPSLFVSDWEPAPARAPAGVTAWAIGDVHGQRDLLDALLAAVEGQMARAPPGPRHLVLLGDYIDRGPENIAALRRAAELTIPGATVTALWGNHEEFLDEFLHDPAVDGAFLEFWIANGGLNTLRDLGLRPGEIRRRDAAAVIEQVRAQVPPGVRAALAALKTSLRLGGYLFVHAGVHPRHPFVADASQRPTTIREPFLTGAGWIHDFAVVHGHTIIGPDVAPHRIAVDSGAFWTGVLTCVELRDESARFIVASREPDLEKLRRIPERRPLSAERWRPLEL